MTQTLTELKAITFKNKHEVLLGNIFLNIGLGLGSEFWCLTPLSTIYQLYRIEKFLLVEETGVTGENHQSTTSH
jgi:hypothetical protein